MDKYDKAVQKLTENPDLIEYAWLSPFGYEEGCLFLCASKSGDPTRGYGCLTMIRRKTDAMAETDSLTERIRADERIPTSLKEITAENLPVFAEWQRIIDKELARNI